MRDAFVSIIIPCFNAESYVADAIESAIRQTYRHHEVIVVDDGSTDASLAAIRSFGSAIRWETGPRTGGAAARNRGLDLAKGELIQFLDADDVLDPDKLERQVPIALSHEHVIAYSDYRFRQADGSIVQETKGRDCVGRDAVEFVLGTPRLQTSAPLHWRFMLDAVGGFRADLHGSQEVDLHLRLAACGYSFRHLPEVLYTVRLVKGSVSFDFLTAVAEQLRILPAIAEELKQRGYMTEERARAFAERLARNGRGCLQRDAYDLGREFLATAKCIHPGGGIRGAYSWQTRWLVRLCGPIVTERISARRRRIRNPGLCLRF